MLTFDCDQAASPSGVYCAAAGATSGKVYIWQVSTGKFLLFEVYFLILIISIKKGNLIFDYRVGRLLRSWDAHYRAVTSLCWSDDSVFIYTGGEDALVKCWTSAELLARSHTSISADDQLEGICIIYT